MPQRTRVLIKDFGSVLENIFERYMHTQKEDDRRGADVIALPKVRRWALWSLQVSNRLNKVIDSHSHDPALPHDVAVQFENDTFRLCGLVTLLGEALQPKGVALLSGIICYTLG